jgi:hypothetical protein
MTSPSATASSVPDPVASLDQAAAAQAARDAELAASKYTGAVQDLVTGDYAVYVDGGIVGWAATEIEGATRGLACKTARSRHSNGDSSLRDDLPCSIEFKLTAKREPYWDIKVYHAPGAHLAAIEVIHEAHERLCWLFRTA